MSSFECSGQKVEVSYSVFGEQHRAISEIIKSYNGGKA